MGLVEEHSTDKKEIKQVIKNATILDAPKMIGVGVVGYMQTPTGMRVHSTVWAAHISESCKRRFYHNHKDSKVMKLKNAFSKHETAMT